MNHVPNHTAYARMKPRPALSVLLMGTALTFAGPVLAEELAVTAAKLAEVQVAGTLPMTAAAVDLAVVGYTEREFYAEGVANRYRGAMDGDLDDAEIIDGNWPYHTRVLVRTPDAAAFNGTLVVEWANVTAGQDIDFAFAESWEYLLSEGYAVAVVSAQNVGVERLKTWSPERYGNLSIAVDNVDPVDGSAIDDCGLTAALNCPGDPLSWDIMTQVSKALKDNAGDNPPLPGLTVEHVIALGESQSAHRLTRYYNTIQPLYGFFDGFVFLDLARQLRADLTVPAISVNSEVTVALNATPTTSEYTRVWDVAGASHASLYGAEYIDNMVVRDQSFASPAGPLSFTQIVESQNCDLLPLFSTVDSGLVLNAALASVDAWIKTGEAAAPTRMLERDAVGAVARDANGDALGGIRIAQFTAPTAFLAPNGKPIFCLLSGHHRDFTAEELKTRYGSHDAYVAQVSSATLQAVEDGYVLEFDADAAIKAAEASDVAR